MGNGGTGKLDTFSPHTLTKVTGVGQSHTEPITKRRLPCMQHMVHPAAPVCPFELVLAWLSRALRGLSTSCQGILSAHTCVHDLRPAKPPTTPTLGGHQGWVQPGGRLRPMSARLLETGLGHEHAVHTTGPKLQTGTQRHRRCAICLVTAVTA